MPFTLPGSYNPFLQQRRSPFDTVQFNGGGESMQNMPGNDALPPQRPNFETPEMPMMSRYRDFLSEDLPRREDYKPRLMDRIAAAATGISVGAKGGPGFNVARDQLERPYNKALEDRATRGKELSAGAKLEYEDVNDKYNRFLRERGLDIQQQNANSLAGRRSNMNTRSDALTEIGRRKLENPNLVWKSIPGGNIVGFDPTGDGDVVDTGISSGLLTDKDKLEINQKNRLGVVAAQGEEARRTEDVRQTGRVDLENTRQGNRQKILEFKKNNPGWRIVASRGGNYFGINPNDPTEVLDTGVSTGTITDAEKAELGLVTTTSTTSVTATDDDGNPSEITRKTTRSRENRPKTSSTTTGTKKKVLMISPDGKTVGEVDEDKVELAKSKGYRVK